MAAEDADRGPRAPDGRPLTAGRRLTFREARAWVRRDSTVLGVQQCSTPVVWAEGDDRAELVTPVRRSEGADCDVSGDVLLFQLADGRRALVIEDLS